MPLVLLLLSQDRRNRLVAMLKKKYDRQLLKVHKEYMTSRTAFLDRQNDRIKLVKVDCQKAMTRMHQKYSEERQDICDAHVEQLSVANNKIMVITHSFVYS